MTLNSDTLESMCELVVDCPHSTPKWTDSGLIVLRNQNIRNGRLDLSNPSYTDEKHFQQRIKRAAPQAGDIVFTREAPMGEVCMIPEGVKCCLGQRQVLLRPKKEVNGKYLLFALQSPAVQNEISWNEGTGSTVSNVRIPVLENLNIPRHPGKEDAIAEILSSLSDKIELNRQINQTLEQIAQAIFKSWFVDFEPVKAKAQVRASAAKGRTPESGQNRIDEKELEAEMNRAAMRAISGKSDKELDAHGRANAASAGSAGAADQHFSDWYKQLKEIAALFPDELVDSELGGIPKGWRVRPLDKIANYLNGLALQKFPAEEGEESLPVIKIAQLKKGDTTGADRASKNIKPEYVIDNGDVIFSWSGSLFIDIWCGGKGALNQHLFKVTSDEFPKWFYLYWTNYHLAEFQRIAADKAVTMGHIKRGHLSSAMCIVPEEGLINPLGEYIFTLVDLTVERRLENVNLTDIRDSLLPKLLSGKIPPGDTQSIAEAVA